MQLISSTEYRFFSYLTRCVYSHDDHRLFLPTDRLPLDTLAPDANLTYVSFTQPEEKAVWQSPSGIKAEFSGSAPEGWRRVYGWDEEDALIDVYPLTANALDNVAQQQEVQRKLESVRQAVRDGYVTVRDARRLAADLIQTYASPITEVIELRALNEQPNPPSIGISPLDAAFLEQQQRMQQQIAHAYTVPTGLMHNPDTPPRSHITQEQFEQMVRSGYRTSRSPMYLQALGKAADFQEQMLRLQSVAGESARHIPASAYDKLDTLYELCVRGLTLDAAVQYVSEYWGGGGRGMQQAVDLVYTWGQEEKKE